MAGARYDARLSGAGVLEGTPKDDTPAFNIVFNYIRQKFRGRLYWPVPRVEFGRHKTGIANIAGSIDATMIYGETNLVIEGTGVVLYGRGGSDATGFTPKKSHVTFDLTGTSFVEVRNVYIVGAPNDPPKIGFLNARGQDLGGTGGNVINNSLIFCHTEGKFRFAAYVALCTDLQTETGCRFVNDLNDQVDFALAAITQPSWDDPTKIEGVTYADARLNHWLYPDVIDSAYFQGGPEDTDGNPGTPPVTPPKGIRLTKDQLHSFQASVVDTCSFIKKNGDGWSLLVTAYGPQNFRNCYANSARGMRILVGNRPAHNCHFDIHHEGGKVRTLDGVTSDHPLRWATLGAIPRVLTPTQGQTAFLTDEADFRGCTFREPSMTMDECFMNTSDASLTRIRFTGGAFDLPRIPTGALMEQLFSAPEKVELRCDMTLGDPNLLGLVARPPSRLRWPGGELSFPPTAAEIAALVPVPPSFSLDFTDAAGAEQAQVTRSTAATYVDMRGRLRTAPTDTPRLTHDPTTRRRLGLLVESPATNRHPYSETFASPWLYPALTATPSIGLAPDGLGHPVVFAPTTALTSHILFIDTPVTAGQKMVWSIFAKPAGYDIWRLSGPTPIALQFLPATETIRLRVTDAALAPVDHDLTVLALGPPVATPAAIAITIGYALAADGLRWTVAAMRDGVVQPRVAMSTPALVSPVTTDRFDLVPPVNAATTVFLQTLRFYDQSLDSLETGALLAWGYSTTP